MNTYKNSLETEIESSCLGAVIGSEDFETKLELVEISNGVIFQFIYIPKGYILKSFTLENHKTHYLGRLNSFNRIKLLDKLKKDNGCLVLAFTKLLKTRGWDFDKFPNPVATVAIHCR